tara:strand:+ start:25506 stop:26078 length:573 start_codon:yes stop_codon:yes gene_type:complete
MAIYGYARVSTEEQNLNMQIDALNEFGVDEIFYEKISGINKERPERSRLLKILKASDTVVFWKLDRLGRDTLDILIFLDEINKKGAKYFIIKENLSPESNNSKMITVINALNAEIEHQNISARTKAGIKSFKKTNGYWGRRKALNKDQIELGLKLYKEGYSPKQLMKYFNVSRGTIYNHIVYKHKAASSN